MKTNIIKSCIIAAALALGTTGAQAQGFFEKLGKSIEKAAKTVEDVTDKVEDVTTAVDKANESVSSSDYLKSIPQYSIKKIALTGSDGKAMLNADGTEQYRYLIVDEQNNPRSSASVLGQYKDLISNGFTVVKGLRSGGLKGGLGKAAEIAGIVKQIGSLKEQANLIKQYRKTFTDEGVPVDAQTDLSNVDGIDFTKSETLSKSSDEVKQAVANFDQSGADLDDFDFDSLGE